MTAVATLAHGQPEYAALLDRIRADEWLVGRMWADAESRPDELDVPGTWWTVVVVDGAPAAWCAARLDGGVLKCHSNYEHPAHRGRGLYAAAYRERHQTVVATAAVPAVTYLFRQPIPLHEADGWYRTGLEGPGELPDHWWWQLRREPAAA